PHKPAIHSLTCLDNHKNSSTGLKSTLFVLLKIKVLINPSSG
ncbi:MAG: hypothetical protein ACI9LM_004856, partial [Alteromonadaceae bacterium]